MSPRRLRFFPLLVIPTSYLASTEMVTESSALVWDRTTIRRLVEHYPRLLENMLLTASDYVTWHLMSHIGIASYTARQRLAEVLITLARTVGQKTTDGVTLDITNQMGEGRSPAGCVTLPMIEALEAHEKRRPAMEKISTVQVFGNEIVKERKLTIGVDLGDRWSFYCVLDEAGKIILEQKVATTPEAMRRTFGKIPRSLIALETGTHSPWVSRLLTELGHEVIVAHAQKVELITKSNRKDDRHDARTLARLARIDPELLGPVRHRSAKAQIHLTVIRARAELVSARTALLNAARGLVKSYGERLPKCGT